jgi:integrase
MHNAWVYQDSHHVLTQGPDKASWYVGWLNQEGKRRCKSFGPGERGQKAAERYRRTIEAELMCGVYREKVRTTWESFRQDYREKILSGLAVRSREEITTSLNHFTRLAKPQKVFGISTQMIDDYVAARRQETNGKGQPIAPATVNKELRHLRAALRVAKEWEHLGVLPKFRMEKVPAKLPVYVPPEHFAKLYEACEAAQLPTGQPYPAADWWRAILIMAYMTGWRIGQLLGLRREDVNLDAGTALSRASDNKGKRDQMVPLHPLVVEHLRKLVSFDPCLFPWHHRPAKVFDEFHRIQEAAEVRPAGRQRPYGFHDLRRAFATMNADRMTPDALQLLMQHRDYQTTQRYINTARQLHPALQNLYVPSLGKATHSQAGVH